MPRLVSLSRAAKLVGISRGELQKKIHDLELESFEGQVNIDDIERIFPDAQIEDNHIIEDLENIIEQALQKAHGKRLAQLISPDPQTLAIRLQSITKELNQSNRQLSLFNQLFAEVQNRIKDLSISNKPEQFNKLDKWLENSLNEIKSADKKRAHIIEKDNILRLMTAQVHLLDSGHEFFVEGNNNILESGLSAGLALNYGCSNGNCGKCKARLISGEIKKTRPYDYVFSENEKLQNYFLCCANTAITDTVIEADEAGSEKDIPLQHISAKIKKIEKISDHVSILNLKTPRTKRLRFLAGQSVLLSYADLPPLEIPIASCPCDDMNIQFHILNPKFSGNETAKHIYEKISAADTINIQGPTGSFVLDEDSNKPVILIAFDTGFAPIKSLVEHVFTLEHAEFINLLWLHSSEKAYLHNHCRAWEDAFDDFKYNHQQQNMSDVKKLVGNLELLTQQYPDLKNINIFIAGPEIMVRNTQQYLLDHNAEIERIKTQSF